MISTHVLEIFSPTMLYAMLFTITGLMGLSMQTLKKQEWTEVSRRNNIYNAKFSVETHLEDGFSIEAMYFQ